MEPIFDNIKASNKEQPRSSSSLYHVEGAQAGWLESCVDSEPFAPGQSYARGDSTYERGWVLILRWEDDGFFTYVVNRGAQAGINDLKQVLEDHYDFSTETYIIPSNNAQSSLQAKIEEFHGAHNNRSDLLLIYYNGYTVLDPIYQTTWQQ